MTVMGLWRDLLPSNKFAVCYQDLFRGIFFLKEVLLILSQMHLNIASTKLFRSNKKTWRQLQDNTDLPVFSQSIAVKLFTVLKPAVKPISNKEHP